MNSGTNCSGALDASRSEVERDALDICDSSNMSLEPADCGACFEVPDEHGAVVLPGCYIASRCVKLG